MTVPPCEHSLPHRTVRCECYERISEGIVKIYLAGHLSPTLSL